jgi:hypothetical protein
MQRRASVFNGYTIEAPDGCVGSVSDMLFLDNDWTLRWFVINTGSWLLGRKILIHPAALGQPDIRQRAFSVTLTKAQVEAGPDIRSDPPVSQQMNLNPYGDYAPNSSWDSGFCTGDGYGMMPVGTVWQNQAPAQPGDPHLRSVAEVTGYHIHALDGDIGHLEDFLVDDETWRIDNAVVDTKHWGFGSHVLLTPAEMTEVNWAERYVRVELTRYRIKCSPSWKEPDWKDNPAS